MTVIGPTLALADAYATAVFAMGESGIGWVDGQAGFAAVGITAAHRVVWTTGAHDILDLDGRAPEP